MSGSSRTTGADAFQTLAGSASVGRVMRTQSGFLTVELEDGSSVTAVLRGKLKQARSSTGLAALGDQVRIERLVQPEGEVGQIDAVVTEILPRHGALVRRAPGPRGVWLQDVLVANVDQLVIVLAAAEPAPHVRLIDRFLALAETDHLESVIVLNKAELGLTADIVAAMERYRRISYRVIETSVYAGLGISALKDELAGKTSAVVGPSGVGKSSLLNAVAPGLSRRVGAVSQAVSKGRHTTRVAEMLALPGGGLVADTPGIREMGLWDVDPGELDYAFKEFRPFLGACRFGDCTHRGEPACAIRQAVADGAISAERYESYAKLLEGDG